MSSPDFADVGMGALNQSAYITRSASLSGIAVRKTSLLVILNINSLNLLGK